MYSGARGTGFQPVPQVGFVRRPKLFSPETVVQGRERVQLQFTTHRATGLALAVAILATTAIPDVRATTVSPDRARQAAISWTAGSRSHAGAVPNPSAAMNVGGGSPASPQALVDSNGNVVA